MLEDKLYDVEHALAMYAYSYVHFPAFEVYNDSVLSQFEETIKNCHIYIIGLLPRIDLKGARQEDGVLITSLSFLGSLYDIAWPLPEGARFHHEKDLFYVTNERGERFFPSVQSMIARLQEETGKLNFNVQYIGQAYGKDGSRNAIDRLKSHETLQKISLQGIPKGYKLEILLLEIQPSNRIVTMFNPNALNQDKGKERISAGTQKLFDTNEQERITLYEASLIRYFEPRFNIEFKENFPSTNMKVLKDCYEKDFSSIIAEICFDHLPFHLFSEKIKPKLYHIVTHDLHEANDRQVFFS